MATMFFANGIGCSTAHTTAPSPRGFSPIFSSDEKFLQSLKEGEDDLENANIEVAVVTVEDGYHRIDPEELEDRGLGV